jgi:para-nitrobenzyl esterase
MSSYWVNFAATGDPNGKGLPKWNAYDDNKNKSAMEFGDKAGMGPAPDEAKLAVFQAYYDKLYAH